MCFSSEASFTASAILGVGGVIALSKSKPGNQCMFAAIPLLFSIQQLFEGFLWKAIHHNDIAEQKLYATIFLFFAQVVWPIWLPLSVFKAENDAKRKKILRYVLIAGITTSLILGLRMLFSEIRWDEYEQHIRYEIKSPQWINISTSILYFIAVIFPGFISTVKGLKVIAIILLTSLIVSVFFFHDYLISIWCYFAAVISIIIIIIVVKRSHGHKNDKILPGL